MIPRPKLPGLWELVNLVAAYQVKPVAALAHHLPLALFYQWDITGLTLLAHTVLVQRGISNRPHCRVKCNVNSTPFIDIQN